MLKNLGNLKFSHRFIKKIVRKKTNILLHCNANLFENSMNFLFHQSFSDSLVTIASIFSTIIGYMIILNLGMFLSWRYLAVVGLFIHICLYFTMNQVSWSLGGKRKCTLETLQNTQPSDGSTVV